MPGGDAGPSDAAPRGARDAANDPPAAHREASIPVGIENVNDSPMLASEYRALLRFVPDRSVAIDRLYFGFKLRGAACWDAGQAGYGAIPRPGCPARRSRTSR